MPGWLLTLLTWLARLLAGPAVARETGRTEALAEAVAKDNEVKDEQLVAASRGGPGRDGTLERMRRGRL